MRAASPGLVVLVAHSVLGELFGHEPYVDPVIHFSGGMAAAFFFWRLPPIFPGWLGTPAPLTRGLMAFGLTSAVAVVWELGEFVADIYLGTRIQRSLGNTMRDLVNGMAGGLVLVGAELRFPRPPR